MWWLAVAGVTLLWRVLAHIRIDTFEDEGAVRIQTGANGAKQRVTLQNLDNMALVRALNSRVKIHLLGASACSVLGIVAALVELPQLRDVTAGVASAFVFLNVVFFLVFNRSTLPRNRRSWSSDEDKEYREEVAFVVERWAVRGPTLSTAGVLNIVGMMTDAGIIVIRLIGPEVLPAC